MPMTRPPRATNDFDGLSEGASDQRGEELSRPQVVAEGKAAGEGENPILDKQVGLRDEVPHVHPGCIGAGPLEGQRELLVRVDAETR